MPLDPEINQNLKVKYRKRLVKYVHAKINQNSSVTRIIKNVNILVAIRWTQKAWGDLSGAAIVLRSMGLSKTTFDGI